MQEPSDVVERVAPCRTTSPPITPAKGVAPQAPSLFGHCSAARLGGGALRVDSKGVKPSNGFTSPTRCARALDRGAIARQRSRARRSSNASLQFRKIVTPLAVGQLLLASLLTLTAGLTLLGRVQARKLALQAMMAYALFLPIDFVARSPMRAVIVRCFCAERDFPHFQWSRLRLQSSAIPRCATTSPNGHFAMVFAGQLAIVGDRDASP